ncbi:hypothetical protein [Lacipirellula sp.]|uniref:hypothetical protein n=1 Tax=Lacipirellula sp. TaxID=2691419 RepID=UPI003D0BD3DE
MSNVIRQTRSQVETLTWLRAILLICAEARRGLDEVSEALRDGEVRTSCATYVAESCLESTAMIVCNFGDFSDLQAAAELLIEGGHADRVKEAAKFATSKLEILDLGGDVDWTPNDEDDAHNLLFELVDENYDEIALLGFSMYVERRLAA